MRKMLASLVVALSLIFATGLSANAAPVQVPALAVGTDEWAPAIGYYIDLDRTDQGAVTSGAAAGVASVICLETDGLLCPAAASLIAAVSFYVTVNGYCPNNLRIYPRYWFMRCV